MTDRERLLELLKSFGIEPRLEAQGTVTLIAKEGGVQGYQGFVCQFEFTPEGSFTEVGLYE